MVIEVTMYVLWIMVAIIAFIIEINTQAQIGYAACLSAVGALIAHAITNGDPIWIELSTFFTLWAILWVALFIFIKKRGIKIHDADDGYLAYIGKSVKAIKGNQDEYGELKFSSKVFRFACDEEVKKGDLIIIEKIKGVTFMVKKVTKKEREE